MAAELCRDVALEAGRRSPEVNAHELWAALEAVDDLAPSLVVDLWSVPAVWWAWWSTGAALIGVTAESVVGDRGFTGERLPAQVREVIGSPADGQVAETVAQVAARRPVDALVIGNVPDADVEWIYLTYAPLVRPGGVVLLHGIANRRTPHVRALWSDLRSRVPDQCRALIGNTNPAGYGVFMMRGNEAASHG